ncbi:MAG: DUF6916 family protein [Allosphingosinicella sp.]
MPDLDISPIRKTRRAVVAGLMAAIGTAAAGAPPLGLAARPWGPLRHAGIDEWRRLVGTRFVAEGEQGRCALRLVAVRPLAAQGRRPAACARSHAFEAVFETAASPAGNRVYRLAHAEHGALDLFVGPAGPAGAGKRRLNAVFN